jgi:ankyrin repeat protein
LGVVQALLDKGAAVNVKANDGTTALMAASQKDHREVRELLLNAGAH